MSSSPEKLGRSSKLRTKSPCSPHAVGDTVEDAEVLVVEEVVLAGVELDEALSDSVPEDEVGKEVVSWLLVKVALVEYEVLDTVTVSNAEGEYNDEVGAWPFAKVVPVELGKLELSAVAVGRPLASELPTEDSACVLGVAEIKLPETLAALLVRSATSTELSVGEAETESSVFDVGRYVVESECGMPP